ncbi:MAG: ion transporter [Alphaproteobacteria bacterium]
MLESFFKKKVKEDRRKIKALIENPRFDFTIMSLILLDAIILGLLTFESANNNLLFLLDRLFVGIFIMEMVLKIITYKENFFKKGWNIFDFVIVAVSSLPIASSFIILRTFRLFRLFKFIGKNSKLDDVFEALLKMAVPLLAFLMIVFVFFYVYAIIGVSLYGNVFVEFSDLTSALFALLQVFTLDNWASTIARSVMNIFPSAWLYFVSFLFISFSLVVSFVVSLIKNKNITVS